MKNVILKNWAISGLVIAMLLWIPDLNAQSIRSFDQSSASKKTEMLQSEGSQQKSFVPDYVHKTDPMIRYVILSANKMQKVGTDFIPNWKELPIAVNDANSMDPMVDIILRVDPGTSTAALSGLGFV